MITSDIGVSLVNKREISKLVGMRLSNTLFLSGFAAIIAVPLSLVLGILSTLYHNAHYDRAVNIFTLTSISFPKFLSTTF